MRPICLGYIFGWLLYLATIEKSHLEPFKYGQPPMRGFLIHFLVYIIVVRALTALNMIINPNHPWVLGFSSVGALA